MLKIGYCVHPDEASYEMHPEQGPVWDWYRKNIKSVVNKLGGNYNEEGAGALKKNTEQTLKELEDIFEITGGNQLFQHIEAYSEAKAKEMQLEFKPEGIDNEYFRHVYTANSNNHSEL